MPVNPPSLELVSKSAAYVPNGSDFNRLLHSYVWRERFLRINTSIMSARYLLLLVIVLYVAFALFVPAMQNIFGYGVGTLIALVILWYVFFNNRSVV
jgi:hypothetical protein